MQHKENSDLQEYVLTFVTCNPRQLLRWKIDRIFMAKTHARCSRSVEFSGEKNSACIAPHRGNTAELARIRHISLRLIGRLILRKWYGQGYGQAG
jgi:hypothetical protein